MLGRRGVLAGALGIAALTACDVDDLRPPEASGTPSADASPSATQTTAADPDATLVNRVVAEIIGASVIVKGARLVPGLRRTLAPLGRMHLAHLDVLGAAPTGPPPVAPASVAAGLRRVRAAEGNLQRALTEAAVAAESGTLARLFASMSAAVAQHVYVLPSPR